MLSTYARNNARRSGVVRENGNEAGEASDNSAFVIETAQSAAGIVIRQEDGYRFFSADAQFSLLDGSIFKTPKAAQKAAELMQRAAARDHAIAQRFGSGWHDRDGRPAERRRA